MVTITDEYMQEMLAKTKAYCLLVLKPGPNRNAPGADQIIREHARRNFALRSEGKLAIVCPVGREIAGIGIFDTSSLDEVHALMREDPAVRAEVLVYELYPCRSFPGDSLPGGVG